MSMFLTRCPLCEHDNPELSKFCNACGVSLLRVGVCARCGALNEFTAAACHQCAAVLREPAAPAAEAAAAGKAEPGWPPFAAAIDADATRAPFLGAKPEVDRKLADAVADQRAMAEPGFVAHRSARRHAGLSKVQRWLIAGSAFGAVIGAFGYFTHSQWTVIEVSGLLPATHAEPLIIGSRPAPDDGDLVNVGVTLRSGTRAAPPQTTTRVSTQRPARPAAPAADMPSPPSHATDTRPPPGSRALAGTTADDTAQIPQPPAHLGPCTAAVAALGLCTPEPSQTRE